MKIVILIIIVILFAIVGIGSALLGTNNRDRYNLLWDGFEKGIKGKKNDK